MRARTARHHAEGTDPGRRAWFGAAALSRTGLVQLGLAVVVTLLTARHITESDFRFPDASRHAMDGVLFLDMVREGGLWDPVDYGRQFYARYPCLGFPYHYPPVFALVEAVFFAYLGPSIEAARLCVLAFHIASALLLFDVARRSYGPAVGVLAALLFAASPVVLFWSQQVMLEAPSVCMMLLATWLLLWYEQRPGWVRAGAWSAALVAAVLTKQTTVFLIPAHALYLLLRLGWKGVLRRELIAAGAAVGGILLPYALFTSSRAPYLMSMVNAPAPSKLSLSHLLNFPALLPETLGWPLVAAAVLGAVIMGFDRRAWRQFRVYGCWLLLFYVMMISLENHGSRYAYFWVPPFAVLGGYGLASLARWPTPRWAIAAALALVLVPSAVSALRASPPVITGYEEAASFVAALPGGGSVLIDSVWDGDFVFFSRQHDRERRLVLRGSKMLYTFASFKNYGFMTLVDNDEDILELLRRYATRYIVVEVPDREGTEPGARLRALVQGDRFRLLVRIPVTGWEAAESGMFLDVYEFPEAREVTAEEMVLHFPGLSPSEITVPLREHSREARTGGGAVQRLEDHGVKGMARADLIGQRDERADAPPSRDAAPARGKLVVIMPALNEEITVGEMVRRIPRDLPGFDAVEAIVVDDGSTDRTAEAARQSGATVVSHPVNLGVGAAFTTGLDAALRRGADVIVNMDSDGQFAPEDIPALVRPIMEEGYGFVTCTRFGDASLVPQMPAIRIWGNRMMCRLVNWVIWNSNFTDVSCGFRAYTRDTVLRMTLFGNFTYTQESFIDLASKKVRMAEVPLRVRGVREYGKSRVASNLWKYACETLPIIVRAMRDTRPLKFFGMLALVLTGIGVILGGLVAAWWLSTGRTSPWTSLITISAACVTVGTMVGIMALIADQLGRVKKAHDELLRLARIQYYGRGSTAEACGTNDHDGATTA